jgi:hypothetical protein
MNTSTQPPDGTGGSRSRAAGELTLGLLSGEKADDVRRFASVGAWLARDGGLTADQCLADGHRSIVGAELGPGGVPTKASGQSIQNPTDSLAA